jgi:hypothetical protein
MPPIVALTLSQLQEIARAPIRTEDARAQAAARLAQSVAQSMRVEGYPVTDQQSAESARRILGG